MQDEQKNCEYKSILNIAENNNVINTEQLLGTEDELQ